MTVEEMIERLSRVPKDLKVITDTGHAVESIGITGWQNMPEVVLYT